MAVSTTHHSMGKQMAPCHPFMFASVNNDYSLLSGPYLKAEYNELTGEYKPIAGFHPLVFIMYFTAIAMALIGNLFIYILGYKVPAGLNNRLITTLLLVNICVGEILMRSFCMPFSLFSSYVLITWPYGRTFCPSNFCMMWLPLYVWFAQTFMHVIERHVHVTPRNTDHIPPPLRQIRMRSLYLHIVIGFTAIPYPIFSRMVFGPSWLDICDKYLKDEVWRLDELSCLGGCPAPGIIPLMILVLVGYPLIAGNIWYRIRSLAHDIEEVAAIDSCPEAAGPLPEKSSHTSEIIRSTFFNKVENKTEMAAMYVNMNHNLDGPGPDVQLKKDKNNWMVQISLPQDYLMLPLDSSPKYLVSVGIKKQSSVPVE